eukprot:8869556-Ditylum_brightwellii.AAC.1
MESHEVDMWGWAETNVLWTEQMLQKTKFLGSKIFKNFTLVGSSSDDPAETYQQGGTYMEVMDKMTGCIIEADIDDSGFGQWSYMEIAGKDQRQITVVTAYKPCLQHNLGDSTVTAQQTRVVHQQGISKPKPQTT